MNEDNDETRKSLHNDIAAIVRRAEERSKHTCEICGREGIIRKDLGWIRTLCDECYAARIKAIENSKTAPAVKAI